jgi:hypothetical protein
MGILCTQLESPNAQEISDFVLTSEIYNFPVIIINNGYYGQLTNERTNEQIRKKFAKSTKALLITFIMRIVT